MCGKYTSCSLYKADIMCGTYTCFSLSRAGIIGVGLVTFVMAKLDVDAKRYEVLRSKQRVREARRQDSMELEQSKALKQSGGTQHHS